MRIAKPYVRSDGNVSLKISGKNYENLFPIRTSRPEGITDDVRFILTPAEACELLTRLSEIVPEAIQKSADKLNAENPTQQVLFQERWSN